jgi:hypothetical protein
MKPSLPNTLALFEKRIDGDDALLELARLRFRQAGMGAEMHAATPEQLEGVLRFRPSPSAPVLVHLPRDFNLVEEPCRRRVREFANRFAGQVFGLLLHDHRDLAARMAQFVEAAHAMNSWLEPIEGGPHLFIEYAAGLPPARFVEFFTAIRALPRITAAIDIGHVGVQQARAAFASSHAEQDICALKHQPDRLPRFLPEIETAVRTALPAVLGLIEALGALGKPLHFHLHDGHPLSTVSPHGVADHLSFLERIPLAFDYQGRPALDLMFGPDGLDQIIAGALKVLGPHRLSFTLEIHPTAGRRPLLDAAGLFTHWRDQTNAEMMNHWLSVLAENHELLRYFVGQKSVVREA